MLDRKEIVFLEKLKYFCLSTEFSSKLSIYDKGCRRK